ncbi:epoxide hydrolase [Burkholderia sp. MSh2]|uniref:Alpha/beta hydrolase n=1 Tax=Burkholderia paludis TaxID=1506587 RepID=A0A6J5E4K3_9BURK|nr:MULTISPECIES: alpha/beta hydrolase [Burkholderia]KEZ02547.1 epoxide hydrolase [Burkholderia sp. MSh2]KFG97985.1 epoxide hydrolase [Burkholderia paludis]CAB3760331.1 Epoxide hydrolase A [Burkholderia paludis]VWC04611.1 alpha/beta hydrolase [Burkholderia paludis]
MGHDWKHGYVHTNGIRMHYVEQGVGPLVLLCHGWPESWFSWRHQIEPLARAGYRVVAMDQRGYGDTDSPQAVESYNVLNLVADLVGLVHALGEERATLVGHDWGAMVVAPAALLRPDMFDRLALLSVPYLPRQVLRPAVRFQLLSQEQHFYQQYFQEPGRIERELEADIRRSLLGILYTASGQARANEKHRHASFARFDKASRLVDSLVFPDEQPAWLTTEALDYFTAQFERSGFRGGINWYRNFDRNWELTAFLAGARILQPTVFITGELDGVLKMAKDEYETLERNVPHLTGKHLIAGIGHFVQQEAPDAVNQLLLSFLSNRGQERRP